MATEGVPVDPSGRAALLSAIAPHEAAANHELLRAVFRAEAEHHRMHGSDEYFENLYWCAFLLYEVGDPTDVPLMWEAKHLDFDTAVGFDVQFLVGAGVEETLAYLRANGNGEIAARLEAYPELTEDLQEWAEFRRRYFYPG